MNHTANRKRIVVLGTGGTIAGVASDPTDNVGYVAGSVGIDELLSCLPVGQLAGVAATTEQLCQVDSKDMIFAIWVDLATRLNALLATPEVDGVVITHGTDTLEETAYFLHRVVDAHKPVVLTCAMRPASASQADGPQNLADALCVAASASSGVLVVCAGVVHAGHHVQKVHSYRLNPFDSGDAGPVAYVEEGVARWMFDGSPVAIRPSLVPLPCVGHWPRVEIMLNHVDADGRLVPLLETLGVRGIVVAGTGNGTLSKPLELALRAAVARGIRVMRVSRCAGGPVIQPAADDLPSYSGLSAVKARIELSLELAACA